MREYAVLTALGEDRPGLVDAVSKFILDCGCNLEDSRMAILGGEFAMLILVSGEVAGIDKLLADAWMTGEKCGLVVHARRTRAPGSASGIFRAGALPYVLEAHSLDHPGIVQRLAHFLAERKVNIRALDTQVSAAPITGLPLFTVHALIDLPAQMHVMELRRGLEEIGADANIDLDLRPAGKRA